MISRIIIWCVLVGLIVYDIVVALFGLPTLSEEVRYVDNELGGLIRFGLLALWAHWFFPVNWRET
jgi:uncharacterized membrane protein YuzA (DUF378 family)